MNTNPIERLKYQIDKIMTRGSFSIIITLTLIVLLIIFILSSLIWILGSNPSQSFLDQLWIYFNTGFGRTAAQGSWVYRMITFLLGLVALFFSSIIIGSIASSINSKLSELRR